MKNVELSGKTEKIEPYGYLGEGRVVDLMPGLVEAGYNPAGVALIIDRRENAPEDVRSAWQLNYFWTGDSAGTDKKGGALLTLNSPLLRQLTSESPLTNGALQLEPKQWKELKADKEHSLYLTPAQVEEAHRKGYVLKDGKFVAANKAVAKAWDFLNEGRDLQNYAQMVSEASKNSYVMRLFFDKSQPSTPTLRSLVVDMISDNSYVLAPTFLNNHHGRLAGVAAHVTRAVKNQGSYRTPASVPRSELEVVLDEFEMADPTELRKVLQLYDAVKNLKL